jgi:parvulin-like peptidyl-prolyl isomerase
MFSFKKDFAFVAILVAAAAGSAEAFQSTKKSAKPRPAGGIGRESVLVVVNGDPISETDLNRAFAFLNVPDDERPRVRRKFIDNLIDTRLIQQFLKSRKTAATKQEIEEQITLLKTQLKKAGLDPDKVLAEKGFTNESLREVFAVPLAWKRHIDRAVTSERLKQYFEAHRAEFDGTRVRASQILIRVAPDDEEGRKDAEAELNDLRKQIVAKKISFEEAARERSQAPSKEQGGDVGLFPFVGKMPQQFSREAFQLKEGEISQPFRSRFGVHLCVVTERKPGDLSLEDVRDDVLGRMRDELWKEMAADLRDKAKIEWKAEQP